MRPLKKGVPLYWEDQAQRFIESLKKALMAAPLLSPLYVSRYFILYVEASNYTIGMVLV